MFGIVEPISFPEGGLEPGTDPIVVRERVGAEGLRTIEIFRGKTLRFAIYNVNVIGATYASISFSRDVDLRLVGGKGCWVYAPTTMNLDTPIYRKIRAEKASVPFKVSRLSVVAFEDTKPDKVVVILPARLLGVKAELSLVWQTI